MFLVLSCGKEESSIHTDVNTLSNTSLSNFTINDFQERESFWNETELEAIISKQKIGKSPEASLVPLVFDEVGRLYNPKNFNSVIATTNATTYFTDLLTFSSVTGLQNLVEYADILSCDKDGKPFFTYDPYVENPIKTELRYKEIKEGIREARGMTPRGNSQKSTNNNPSGLWIADVPVGYMSGSWRGAFGHAGIVYKLKNNTNQVGSQNVPSAKLMEAVGDMPNVNNEVLETRYDAYWTSQNFNWLFLCYAPNASWSERNDARNYAKQQDPDEYSLWTSKWNSSSWYCSKLAWKAYYEKIGIDIDYNGGYYVFPADIAIKSMSSTEFINFYSYYK